MKRKTQVDWVILNVHIPQQPDVDALAIKDDVILDFGRLTYIFSNYGGKEIFNGQENLLEVDLVKYSEFKAVLKTKDGEVIAKWRGGERIVFNNNLLNSYSDRD